MAEDDNLQSQESTSEALERNRQNKEKWLSNQSRITHANYDKGHTLQDSFREWLDKTGTVTEANKRIAQPEPDKYTPNTGGNQVLQEQMLTWLDGLEQQGQNKDRSR